MRHGRAARGRWRAGVSSALQEPQCLAPGTKRRQGPNYHDASSAPTEGKAGRSRTYAERFVPTIGASGNKVGTRKPNEINVFPLFPLFPHKKRQPEGAGTRQPPDWAAAAPVERPARRASELAPHPPPM